MPDESVRVAVRVRPFNQREKDRKATCVIQMNGQMTSIKNPDTKEEAKKFSFDYSYWSHDGFQEDNKGLLEPKGGSKYASQRIVFNDLGQGVLDNAWQGYNCSLFAYGQTGSGKSYSMVGYGVNRGIVPMTCDELFKAIEKAKSDGNANGYEITFSMLEIYNEAVRDLLSKDNPKGGLPVRQNPTLGLFYVQGLKKVPVGSYAEIDKRMEQGTANRTVASTQMNATSSRAHTVVTITFDQIIKNAGGKDTKKSSVINLVDLAGSERADSTGATGDRLKEGANINKSLSALGNVISALADLALGKKKIMVPYRDSVLTKLLQNALGGNSKTIMIAALSPANINYDETLSTLRYADRAKKIKNKATVNENPMDKMIRQLREENEMLKKQMEGGGTVQVTQGMTPAEIEKMKKEMEEQIRAQLLANQEALKESDQSWEEKLKEARAETSGPDNSGRKNKDPYLLNLNEDPMLSGVVAHFLDQGETTIGRKDGSSSPKIPLSGLSITKDHAVIVNSKKEIEIRPGSASAGLKTKVNGVPLTGPRVLEHTDRILFGSNHMYVFINPKKGKLPPEITWEFAQKEIAQAKGFATESGAGLSKEQQIAQEQVLESLPMVSEVNAMSEELNKHRTFEVVLISSAAQEGNFVDTNNTNKGTNIGKPSPRVMVKMKNLLNGNTWLWERGKFMNRRYLIQDLYQRWLDGDDSVLTIPKEEDPFWEPTEDVLIGTANVFLQSLAYALDFDDKISVTDYKGQEEGSVYITVTPCTQTGKPLDEDYFVDDPNELIGKPYHFKVQTRSVDVHKARFSKGLQAKYKVFKDTEYTETKMIKGTLSPEFNHSKIFSFPKLEKELLDYFENGCITFLLYGIQEDQMTDPKLAKMTTKELRQMEYLQNPNEGRSAGMTAEMVSGGSQMKSEYMLLAKKYERLAAKEKRMQELVKEWQGKKDGEKDFDSFMRAVNAVANSSGTKLRTRVEMVNKVLSGHRYVQDKEYRGANSGKKEEDTISLFVFGADELDLAKEYDNNGYVQYNKIEGKHYSKEDMAVLAKHKAAQKDGKVVVNGEESSSKACVIQ